MPPAIAVVLVSANALAQSARRIADGTAVPVSAQGPDDTGDAYVIAATHDPVVAIINERGFACSGVLIHPRAVLTARHCRSGRVVVFGATTVEPRASVRVIGFRGAPNRAIDLGLMLLAENAPIAPYPLRRASEPPRQVRVVGFGCAADGDCDGAGRRSYFDARLPARNWGCEPVAAGRLDCMPSTEMVLPRSIGVDTCTGDSGGAVLEQTDDSWQLAAITSRGVRNAVLACGDGGVYVRVQPQLHWIARELEKLSQ